MTNITPANTSPTSNPNQHAEPGDIAIVGLGCWYPGARNPRELWENILAGRRQFRKLPASRLHSEYFSDDRNTPDSSYCQRAAVIDGFSFDAEQFRIPQTTKQSTDVAHWLALHVASQAIQDAGLLNAEGIMDERLRSATGVIVGNTLTGEQTRSNSLRLRWPFVRRALEIASQQNGLSPSDAASLAETMEHVYKSAFAEVNEDTLAGGLSNTIAGRICNHFDFHGGGFTIDGACSSSLLAVCKAADALTQGRLDVALAGGVDISLDPFELIGFAKIGALASEEMRVYDRRGDGFLPGEGCGFVVMKRALDARQQGDQIYAIIRGWGISSDGRGAITAPTVSGQKLALQRAYQQAGYPIHSIDFVEGHGTGTAVGDRVEIQAIASLQSNQHAAKDTEGQRQLGLTSVKSIIGHTKAAAGIAGLLKTVMAVNRRVLPPLSGCAQPHKSFEDEARTIYPLRQGRKLSDSDHLRGGVSAMGFGGINTHVTLESADDPNERLNPAVDERALLASQQAVECFLFSAGSWQALGAELESHAMTAEQLSEGELVDLAYSLAQRAGRTSRQQAGCRAALLAARPKELCETLRSLAKMIREIPAGEKVLLEDTDGRWFLGRANSNCRIGFVFPGQGSQQLQMGRELIERFGWARDVVSRAEECFAQEGLPTWNASLFGDPNRALNRSHVRRWEREISETNVAQPAICLTSVLYGRLLQRLGLQPDIVCGHSLGELTALHFAGAYDEKTLYRLSAIRGRIMHAHDDSPNCSTDRTIPAASSNENPPGGMLSLRCRESVAEELAGQVDGVVIANRNGVRQFVASGNRDAIERLGGLAKNAGVASRMLPVCQAFHSPLMKGKAERFRQDIKQHLPAQGQLNRAWISTVAQEKAVSTAANPPAEIDLVEHLAQQMTSPVDFVYAAEQLLDRCDLILEVGPGRVLSDLLREQPSAQKGKGGANVFPVAGAPGQHRDLLAALSACYVRGVELDWTPLYEGRLVRAFTPAEQRKFIGNPCERLDSGSETEKLIRNRPLVSQTRQNSTVTKAQPPIVSEPITGNEASSPLEFLTKLAIERTGFSAKRVSFDSRLLDDLNLDSIKAAELVSTATQHFGVAAAIDPANFANDSLLDVATAIDAQVVQQGDEFKELELASELAPSSSLAEVIARYPSWVRNFVVEYEPPASDESP